MQWLNGASPDCGIPLSMIPCDNEAGSLNNVQLFTLVDNPFLAAPGDVVGSANEATVLRIVGEIDLCLASLTSPTPAAVTFLYQMGIYMGIYVGDTDQAAAAIVKDPFAQQDMNSKDWLWRGSFFHSESGIPGTSLFTVTENDPYCEGTNANGSHLDIKVKRKLRPEESLILAINPTFDDILNSSQLVFTLQLYANLRVLVGY